MSPDQDRYLLALLDKSDTELLYEVAAGSLTGITASARPPYEQKSAESRANRLRQLLAQVPRRPIEEFQKEFLTPFLTSARKQVQTSHAQLYRLLCDATTYQPTALALDITTGQIKDIIAGVATVLMTHYSTAASVAIPVAVLLARNGLKAFCTTPPSTL